MTTCLYLCLYLAVSRHLSYHGLVWTTSTNINIEANLGEGKPKSMHGGKPPNLCSFLFVVLRRSGKQETKIIEGNSSFIIAYLYSSKTFRKS